MNLPEIVSTLSSPTELRELARLAVDRADQLQAEGIARLKERVLADSEALGVDPSTILGIAANKTRGRKNSKHRDADNQ